MGEAQPQPTERRDVLVTELEPGDARLKAYRALAKVL